ncbi:MAG: hypothetical protein LBN27_13020 [Prevotellaceae bacterium]|jgi:hypothetical protein|nr:hypothetical protein [Prevotellaceae bacterium]
MKKIILILTALMLTAANAAFAKTVFVSDCGTAGNSGLTKEQSKPLTNQTIAGLNNGDTIVVLPGRIVLSETIELAGKSVSIIGYNKINSGNTASNAVLDGRAAGRIFNITGNGNLNISNLVFENATDKALQIDGTDADLMVNIVYCYFFGNTTAYIGMQAEPYYGAGVTVIGGAETNILACRFVNNQAFCGGALFIDGSTAKVNHCEFTRNFARKESNPYSDDANSRGGAVACAGQYDIEFNYCSFNSNYSHRGGGCFFIYGAGDFVMKNSSVVNNYSGSLWKNEYEALGYSGTQPGDNHGGAFTIFGQSDVTFINTTIANNTAYGDAIGGAMYYVADGNLTMINTTVTGNATYGNLFHTGGLFFMETPNVKIYNSIIERNYAIADNYWSDIIINSETIMLTVEGSVLGVLVSYFGGWGFYSEDNSIFTYSYDPVSRDEEYGEPNKNVSGVASLYYNCVPLLANSIAKNIGKPLYLALVDIDTDQKGNPRNMQGNIFAGAIEATEGETEKLADVPAPSNIYAYSDVVEDLNVCETDTPNPGGGVEINGIVWATRNVGAPGTFVDKPEDYGGYYQWNSPKVWSDTSNFALWNNEWNGNSATTWENANNVCPLGWRIPTAEEHQSLIDAGSVWTIKGRIFGSGDNTIFLPASGFRFDNALYSADTVGYYWSSAPNTLNFADDYIYRLMDFSRSAAASVRCVSALPDVSEIGVAFVPSDTTALLVWLPNENAEGYRLLIYADEARTNLICELEFNAAGTLVNAIIHRAKSKTQAASQTFTYTLENLLGGTSYYYTLETLGAGSEVLDSKSGSFTTTGSVPTAAVVPVSERSRTVAYYNLLGQKLLQEPASGIYIIVYDNGKVEKIVK